MWEGVRIGNASAELLESLSQCLPQNSLAAIQTHTDFLCLCVITYLQCKLLLNQIALDVLVLSILAIEWFQMTIKSGVSSTGRELQCPQAQCWQWCHTYRIKYAQWSDLHPGATLGTRSIFQNDLQRSTPTGHCEGSSMLFSGKPESIQSTETNTRASCLPELFSMYNIHIHKHIYIDLQIHMYIYIVHVMGKKIITRQK